MPIKTAKGYKAKCDKLFSKIIRSTGLCDNCLRRPPEIQLQCSHIISRKYAATRCDLRNATCLCAGCHRYFTDHPVDFSKYVISRIGQDTYDELYRLAHTPTKVDWQAKYNLLKEYARINNLHVS